MALSSRHVVTGGMRKPGAIREQTFHDASVDLNQCLHSCVSRVACHHAVSFVLGDGIHDDDADTNNKNANNYLEYLYSVI